MADIELVIKISEEEYINIKNAINSLIENGVERASMSKACLAILDGTPFPRCKDCKWWKDSNGAFRRGIGAESICRINTDIVYQGEGYCYLFEPKESEG